MCAKKSTDVSAETLAGEAAGKWQTTFDAMVDAVFLLDENQCIVLANKAASALFGCFAEGMQGHHCWEVVHNTGAPVDGCPVRRMLKTGHRETMELPFGDSCFQVTADPLLGKDGKLCGAVHIVRDITARKRAEQALQKSERDLTQLNLELEDRVEERHASFLKAEERFRELFSFMANGVAIYDAHDDGADFIFLDINASGQQISNITLEEAVGRSVLELFPSVRDNGFFEVLQRVWRTGTAERHPIALYQDERIERWVENNVFKLPSGEVVAVYEDFTQRKKAEQQLRESEERFRTMFEEAPDASFLFNMDKQVIDCNKAAERLTDYRREELIGHDLFEAGLLSSDVKTKVNERVARLAQGENLDATEYVLRRKDGIEVSVEVTSMPFHLNGKPVLLGSGRDLTQRKQAERLLAESEEKYRMLFETESDAIVIFDGGTRRFLDVNNAAVELYGYTREKFLQLEKKDISAEPQATEKEIRKTLASKPSQRPLILSRHKKKDGSVFTVEIRASSFFWQERPVICAVIRDVSRRMRRDEEILKNRVELRQLASELSVAEQRERERVARELHDGVSQLLSSSCLRLNILKASELPEPARESLDTISGIIGETLQHIRSLTFELSCPMLNELGLVAALDELSASMTREQEIHIEFSGDAQSLPMKMDQQVVLYRAIRELLINVMKHSGASRAEVNVKRDDDHALITVADNGRGFDAEMAGKGFSPSGGFGLFNIRESVTYAGGQLQIDSVPGEGTKVMLRVPLEKADG